METQLIVQSFNSPPFNKSFTLVTFDELSPVELFQLMNDVFAELDKAHKLDVREESKDAAAPRIVNFLILLKYPVPDDLEAFAAQILKGDRAAIYPILSFIFAKFPQHKKRAYVARYLVPVEVPPEFAHDDAIQAALSEYRILQAEFKDAHKAMEKAGSSGAAGGAGGGSARPNPSELRKEVSQLEDERGQLIEKIASLKKRTAEVNGFQPLLEATSNLRKEQEEEGRLHERMHEQRLALSAAEQRYAEANRRLAETRAVTSEDMTAEAVLAVMRKETAEKRSLARSALPSSIEARRETLGKLMKMLMEPTKTEEDLYRIRGTVQQLEAQVTATTQALTAAQSAAGDEKLAMYRQQAALIAKKLQQKEEAVQLAEREADALGREVEAKEAKLSELSGPRYMKREEFKAYAATLRQKTATFKELKLELAGVRQESIVLARTEQILKSRAGDLDEFLRKLESRKGVSGYTAVQSDLEQISALKAKIDEAKGKTLDHISRIVEEINSAIKAKKEKLSPAVKELRRLRGEFGELEGQYLVEKAAYENVLAGLEAERGALEREAAMLQDEATAEESRYHSLQFSIEATQAALERAREEAAYERGEGRFLRDFRTLKELYTQKLSQLEAISKELRRKQKDIKENAAQHAVQRQKFLQVKKLLAAKMAVYAADATGGIGRGTSLGLAGLAAAAAGGSGGAAAGLGFGLGARVEFEDTGGANVMTLDNL